MENEARYGDEPTYIVEAPKTSTGIKIKKLHPDAVIPAKATPQSAGYDLYAPEDFTVRPGRSVMPLGLAMELPRGFTAIIKPRSGYSSEGFAGKLASTEYRFDAVRARRRGGRGLPQRHRSHHPQPREPRVRGQERPARRADAHNQGRARGL